MFHHTHSPKLARSLFAFAAIVSACLFSTNSAFAEDDALNFLRVTQPADQQWQLEVAARTYTPKHGSGPAITLVSAVHIGEMDYYLDVQKLLDEAGLVLFEGVKPEGLFEGEPGTDEAKASLTKRRLRTLGVMLHRYHRLENAWPADLEKLEQTVRQYTKIKAEMVQLAREDGWGREVQYEPKGDDFTLTSLGSDGKPGGDGYAADILSKDEATRTEALRGEGIQKDLANALGLTFQLDAIVYDRPHFINSDMTVGRIVDQANEAGGDADPLLQMLDGTGMMAGVAKALLGMIQTNSQLQSLVKLMMLETLPAAEEGLLESDAMPPRMRELMKVILHKRNEIVINDIKAQIARPNPADNIAVFYGAAHMKGLQEALLGEMGYESAEVKWLPAMHVDMRDSGWSEAQINAIRKMMQGQLEQIRNQ